ncbi:aminodeoxychorismate synthase component I [Nitrincola sp. MINF-07-Sa-05]|uniref:aminodeoxychorismate synthase component I n=1 Tax=Nitrincola salilacus TaxID=3400273 RepID=UPI00391846C8
MIRRLQLPDTLSTPEVFNRIRALGNAVLLDSCGLQNRFGRFDILSAEPDAILRLNRGHLTLTQHNQEMILHQDPFEVMRSMMAEMDRSETDDLPFCGGLIGHFGYDLGRYIERLPSQAQDDIDFPELRVGRYRWAVVRDNRLNTLELIADDSISESQLEALRARILQPVHTETPTFTLNTPFINNLTEADYQAALTRINEYIHAGDCYQINFAQRFTAQASGDSWKAYQLLRKVATTPFAAYLESQDGAVLSLSPERFLRCEPDGQIETRPIKGTRPRGKTPEEDQQLADELINSTKDRAENVMIVDLLRNDLSKVAATGSVKVPELFALESYPNVHHLVSSVTARLADNKNAIELLKHCFPGGSITGAPKIRAMEIIDELEPHRRSIYCGSIGYISACGRMDTNITIRTLLHHQNQVYCWGGGGIVADSEIESEYQETFNKVNNLLRCLELTLQK